MSPKCVYGEHELHLFPNPCPSGQGWPCEPEPTPSLSGHPNDLGADPCWHGGPMPGTGEARCKLPAGHGGHFCDGAPSNPLPHLVHPADFASLLEREHQEEHYLPATLTDGERQMTPDEAVARGNAMAVMAVGTVLRAERERDKYKALWQAEQQMRRDDAVRMATLERGVSSASARISSLEGVLREIRGKLTRKIQPEVELWNAVNEYTAACGGNLGKGGPITGRRMNAVVGVNRAVRMIPDSIISLISETLDPHKPWCRDENHQGLCLSDPEERDDGE